MRYLICYDIREPRVRRAVVKVLEVKGIRAQYSVFLANLTEREASALKAELEVATARSNSRSVLIVPICAACAKGMYQIGELIEEEGRRLAVV